MRKDHNILDEGMFKGGSILGWNDEEMLWVGKSKGPLVHYTAYLDEDAHLIKRLGMKPYSIMINVIPIVFGVLVAISFFGVLPSCIMGIAAFVFYYRAWFFSRVIRYGVSGSYVYFEKRNGLGRRRVHLLSIDDIDKVHIERNENGTSSLHLVTSINPGFSTYQLFRREKRPFPTIEYIDKPKHVVQLLNERIRRRNRK